MLILFRDRLFGVARIGAYRLMFLIAYNIIGVLRKNSKGSQVSLILTKSVI